MRQRDDPVVILGRQLVNQLVLVGDHHHRDAHLVDGLEQLHDVHAHFGVQVAGRLVRNDELGAMHQRPGHRHALLLAAGKLVRQAVHLVLQTHKGQGKGHAGLDVLGGNVGDAHGKCHVFIHRHGGDEAEILEHHAHLPAQERHLFALDLVQVLPVDGDGAAGGPLLHLHQLDEGGFARAGMAQHPDKLALIDMQTDVLQRHILGIMCFIRFGNVFKIDHYFAPVMLHGPVRCQTAHSGTYNNLPYNGPAVKFFWLPQHRKNGADPQVCAVCESFVKNWKQRIFSTEPG